MTEVVGIGSRRELFVDDALVERFGGGAQLRLHQPTPREVAFVSDAPWEGCMNNFITVLRDGDRFRMYYRGWHVDLQSPESHGEALHVPRPPCICLAESADGIHWTRAALGHLPYQGTRENSIVWVGVGEHHIGVHGFSPFIDPNPACPPDARYKAIGVSDAWPIPGIYVLTSPDGIHWTLRSEEPVITEGMFDSQNVAFWDAECRQYCVYLRDMREGRRDIRTATSPDFLHWTTPEWLEYPGAPPEQLYTNNVQPYYRAPHLLVGFPARYVEREWTPTMEALPELEHRRLRAGVNPRFGTALSDALFMSSRDGRTFHRWGEAFIRPGLRACGNWTYGDNYPAYGLLETESDLTGGGKELSLFATEGYWRGAGSALRRYTLRIDGFVSVQAPLAGGELLTKPLCFAGTRLSLNLSTSAAGHARVALLDVDGQPIPGFTLEDCWEIVGDTLDYTVLWKQGADVRRLAGKAVRLHILLQDADLFSFCFAE